LVKKDSNSSQGIALPKSITKTNQNVPEYFAEVFNYMKLKESAPLGNYCEKSINISQKERG